MGNGKKHAQVYLVNNALEMSAIIVLCLIADHTVRQGIFLCLKFKCRVVNFLIFAINLKSTVCLYFIPLCINL